MFKLSQEIVNEFFSQDDDFGKGGEEAKMGEI